MRGPLNISVTETKEGEIGITLGRRDAHLGMSTIIDREQALVLFDMLGLVLRPDMSKQQYQEWLAKQAFNPDGQLDQGAEIIPFHTMDDDSA